MLAFFFFFKMHLYKGVLENLVITSVYWLVNVQSSLMLDVSDRLNKWEKKQSVQEIKKEECIANFVEIKWPSKQ